MKINLDAEILDLSDQPMKMDDQPNSPNATLKTVACDALMSTYRDEPDLSGDAKVKRFKLSLALHAGGVQEVSPEDVVELRKLIGKRFSTLVVGRAFDLLDPQAAA